MYKASFYAPEIKDGGGGGYCFCPVCHSVFLSLSFCHALKNFNLGYNFLMASTRALIFHY
jgi:hypothetical protein